MPSLPRTAPHLLRVDGPPAAFTALFDALANAGLRAGWLELEPPAPTTLPPALEAAASLGALRAVAVGGGRSVAVKPMRGAPVLRDVLREHFRGCALVLVRGEPGDGSAAAEAPQLERTDGGWRVERKEQPPLELDPDQLAARLRRPRPWRK